MRRSITLTAILQVKRYQLPPRPKFTAQMEYDIEETFLHGGSGAGGQKINKTNSKVQLKHLPTGIVVTSQKTRSRDQNRKDARERMAYELAKLENANSANETERDVALRQLKQQSKKSKDKKSAKKYKEHDETNERLKEQERLEEEAMIRKMLQN